MRRARTAWLRSPLRRATLRKRRDGLDEVARVGRLRRVACAVALVLLALPAVGLSALALVALLPPLLFAAPAALLCAGLLLLASRDLGAARRAHAARVLPLRHRDLLRR